MKPQDAGAAKSTDTQCPICGGSEFADHPAPRGPKADICTTCGSNRRMRIIFLLLNGPAGLAESMRILHFAPEPALMEYIAGVCGENYEVADLKTARYQR